jgi:hypothetical protein
MQLKEKNLFPPLKAHFKQLGYKVYAEVPCFYRGVDFVAAKGDDHIAVEMKTSFNDEVVRQASSNIISFGKSYVAYPVRDVVLIPDDYEDMQRDNHRAFRKLRQTVQDRVSDCQRAGIGILQVVGKSQIVVEVLEAKYQKPYRVFDFSVYRESKNDEAGLPFQKGVSAGYEELKAIKRYVRKHPAASWPEIFQNVQNHYSDYRSLAGSMRQWRGFSLSEFRKSVAPTLSLIEQNIPVEFQRQDSLFSDSAG